eukprot:jgi/Galph1/3887/GphlegSOOS_G2518.1
MVQTALDSTIVSTLAKSIEEEGNGDDWQAKLEESANSDNQCVRVVIRVRPLNTREKDTTLCLKVSKDGRSVTIQDKGKPRQFTFDSIFSINEKQQNVFNNVAKPVIDSCFQGYNGTIFAYGQTGSGKTFTMQGPEESIQEHSVFEYIFDTIRKEKEEKGNIYIDYVVKCTYLQVYNETITDLLVPSKQNLNVREDSIKGIYVEDLTEEIVMDPEECYRALRKGVANRTVGATSMNQESSRSHGVFTVIIERMEQRPDGILSKRTSRLNLVDLAGSERQKLAKTSGQTLKEANNINRSLTVLGYVIMALVDASNGKERHINYRDSKLTFLLKDSLGGNAKTCMVATVSPSEINVEETLSTIKFAQRAKHIRNKAHINEQTTANVDQLQAEVKKLQEFIRQLLKEREVWIHHATANDEATNKVEHSPSVTTEINIEGTEQNNFVEDASVILRDKDDIVESQPLLGCIEGTEGRIMENRRCLEDLLLEVQTENKKREDLLKLLEMTCKNLMQRASLLVFDKDHTSEHVEIADEVDQMDFNASVTSIEMEEQMVKTLCSRVERMMQIIQNKEEEMELKVYKQGENVDLQEFQSEQDILQKAMKKEHSHNVGNCHRDLSFLTPIHIEIVDSERNPNFVKEDSPSQNLLNYDESVQLNFLNECLEQLFQVEARQGETVRQINAEQNLLQNRIDELKYTIKLLSDELQTEKESAFLEGEQVFETELGSTSPNNYRIELEEKIEQLQWKVHCLQNYRNQLQCLVDKEMKEIKRLRRKARLKWEELITERIMKATNGLEMLD